jgi:hypothetical protein
MRSFPATTGVMGCLVGVEEGLTSDENEGFEAQEKDPLTKVTLYLSTFVARAPGSMAYGLNLD